MKYVFGGLYFNWCLLLIVKKPPLEYFG